MAPAGGPATPTQPARSEARSRETGPALAIGRSPIRPYLAPCRFRPRSYDIATTARQRRRPGPAVFGAVVGIPGLRGSDCHMLDQRVAATLRFRGFPVEP